MISQLPSHNFCFTVLNEVFMKHHSEYMKSHN